NKLEDGYHTLTASYGRLQSRVSFRIVIDEAKTIPLLEKLATAPPVKNGDETDKLWAEDQLREIRLPSISGMVTDTAGQPLDHVDIKVSEENLADETRANGRYDFRELKPGRTYTLTPFLQTAGDFSAEWTFQPASRTITNLNSKLTEMNFVATRVRPMVNVASKREGATARASSTHSSPDGKFEVEGVIDEVNAGPWELCCNAAWVDDTPNIYPDWVEINFKEPSGIDWINVFTLQDHPEHSHDPTLDETFTRDGITDFDVQYWTGRGWQLVPGGAIRGNRNVWRKIAFPTLTTNKIRVVVRKALTPYSKIKEVEAIHVNQFPVVKLTGSSNVTTGSSFQFQADISDHDGWLSKYSLDFGDGSPSDQKEFDFKSPTRELNLTPAHTYAAAGTYVVTLRAIDNKFEGSETSMTITVTDPKPATLPRKLSATRQ
ncbi:MAG TPA: PKD domain-containing protein, partial [Pyrinomonadaceae bacterium]|nr:PKD domain-containing protein [Pyrinomonadaceae bacterium]